MAACHTGHTAIAVSCSGRGLDTKALIGFWALSAGFRP